MNKDCIVFINKIIQFKKTHQIKHDLMINSIIFLKKNEISSKIFKKLQNFTISGNHVPSFDFLDDGIIDIREVEFFLCRAVHSFLPF